MAGPEPQATALRCMPLPRSLWARCWSADLCWTARTRCGHPPTREHVLGTDPRRRGPGNARVFRRHGCLRRSADENRQHNGLGGCNHLDRRASYTRRDPLLPSHSEPSREHSGLLRERRSRLADSSGATGETAELTQTSLPQAGSRKEKGRRCCAGHCPSSPSPTSGLPSPGDHRCVLLDSQARERNHGAEVPDMTCSPMYGLPTVVAPRPVQLDPASRHRADRLSAQPGRASGR